MIPFRFLKSRFDKPEAPQEQLDTVFEYILLDDVPHFDTPLPTNVLPLCTPQEVGEGYRLCWQLLEQGVNRRAFSRLTLKIACSGHASPEEQRDFKYARAKFKHMRFACANFAQSHRYPILLHIITIIMGNMQDAFKNHQRTATLLNGLLLWYMLTPPFYWLIRLPLIIIRLGSPEDILNYQKKQNKKLARLMTTLQSTTGHEFHVMRKIISRRVSFNDTLRTIRPSHQLNQLSEYLATVNGMMGDMHDTIIEKKLNGTQSYHRDRFQPPSKIIERINAFLSRGEKETSH
ncbi:hypothetical protein GS501_08880 [Saccharibacter sp. 17.LH.SD]|uniref:hypothetical protein n=1 Tax=Saccharibacter sp. 17.LH.SD TaxID=2689393 RepID=UPI001371C97F|nr:hypothetical protein [Saccharibacter sp. 17.LH.SD]MXV45147.1 hypothetical protein [Saccharibacter sp. 17.LH.SD]